MFAKPFNGFHELLRDTTLYNFLVYVFPQWLDLGNLWIMNISIYRNSTFID